MKRVAAYISVYNAIKKDIRDGEYADRQFLPTEPELEAKYNVSRTTIRKAIEMLAHEGYVYVKQGRGTEIMDVVTRQSLNKVTSISETMRAKGYDLSTKSMHIDEIAASSKIAKLLEIEPDAPVIRIQRLLAANDIAISYVINYLSKDRFPDFMEKSSHMSSLYMFLEQEYGVIIDSAEDTIFAKTADLLEAELLKIPIGAPVFCNRRVSKCEGVPVTYDVSDIRYDKYEMHVTITG